MPPITVRRAASPNPLCYGDRMIANRLNDALVRRTPWAITFKRAEKANPERPAGQAELLDETK